MAEFTSADLEVNYEEIAATYDRRYDQEPLQDIARALEASLSAGPQGPILEVGCGTGHWLAALALQQRFLVGLDLSPGMLRRAQRREAAFSLTCGKAQALPFPDRTFQFLYVVNALHHFAHKRRFLAEVVRVLAPGGSLALVTFDPRAHQDWFIYRYFAGTYEIDLQRMPAPQTIRAWLEEAGLAPILQRVVAQVRDDKWGREVLDDPFLEKQGTSELALLSDEAYEAGLRRIRSAIAAAEGRGEQAHFPARIDFVLTTARLKEERR